MDGTLEGGSNGTKTFEIEWLAPPEDGDIIFYAAGNAANRNNSNTGDRIYTTQNRVQPDSACGASERPILTRIVDAASGTPAGSSNSILTLLGRNFATGTSREAHGGYIRDGKYPSELNCVGVEIAGQRVPILYVQGDQINVQAPTLTQTGTVPVRVIVNPDRQNAIPSDPATVNIQNFSPSFFTFSPTRSIAARIPNGGPIIADPSVVSRRPSHPTWRNSRTLRHRTRRYTDSRPLRRHNPQPSHPDYRPGDGNNRRDNTDRCRRPVCRTSSRKHQRLVSDQRAPSGYPQQRRRSRRLCPSAAYSRSRDNHPRPNAVARSPEGRPNPPPLSRIRAACDDAGRQTSLST